MSQFPKSPVRPVLLVVIGLSAANPTALFASFEDPDPGTRVPIENPDIAEAAGLLERGEQSLRSGRYAEAGRLLARVVALDPNNPHGRLLLAFSEFAVGDFNAAAITAHEVMKATPDLAAANLDMRGSFSEAGFLRRQTGELEKIAMLQPETSSLRYLLGFVRYFTGDRDSGARILLDYTAANPDDRSIKPFVNIAAGIAPPPTPLAAQPLEPNGPPAAREDDAARYEIAPPEKPRLWTHAPHEAYRYQSRPRLTPPRTYTFQRTPARQTAFEMRGESLTDIAIREFCRANRLDPFENEVIARVTDVDYHDETGTISDAEVKVRWVEWKPGRFGARAKHKSDTVDLEFDEYGRLTDYDD